ncbi:hypothetical protein [Amycolatopsis alkalitolerans]|uniref:Lipoprotein n=1 Tax=Amycolatopsis alkalitolerans TaxID=2547244 RepID=A0A5C4LSU9_9PSEU|nr:hypothetical protein [Amycolatopsis alkalitolerans]TNC19823.1 hypothetical protein FG385_31905 [Amycolatopsis alkalitolerans]
MTRRSLLLVPAAAGLLMVGACAGTTTAPPAPATSAGGVARTDLAVAQSTSLGPIVTDSAGRTLYRFDRDSAAPPTSNCLGACASAWPPAVVSSATPSATGIAPGLVGTIKRADGTLQLTLGGWPLYGFEKDTAAGQTNGQGVVGFGAAWYAVTPQGTKASASTPSPSTSAGGYGY